MNFKILESNCALLLHQRMNPTTCLNAFSKWLGAIATVFVIAIAIFLINLIWFRPWSLNLFDEKVFAEIPFDHPEILSTLGLVEQFGITGHNGKLDDESPAHQQREFDRWKRDLAQVRQYPLDRQSPSQKLSTRVLDWFLQIQAEGEKCQWHDYPVNQLFGVQNQLPSFMANTHRLLAKRTAITILCGSMRFRKSSISFSRA